MQLANNLQAILTQQLLPRNSGDGRALAYEFLIATPGIRNLIREGKTHQIPAQIQMGGAIGMLTMDACLAELHLRKVISFETGLARSVDAKEFERLITTGGQAQGASAPQTAQRAVPPASTGGSRGGTPPVGRSGRG